jgi:DNA-binding CsgD family transcriptional regulator
MAGRDAAGKAAPLDHRVSHDDMSSRRLLLERETEIEALGELLRRAGDGDGGLAVLQGPAGIGKSSLLAAFAAQASQSGFNVGRARGDVIVTGSSFAAVRELFWAHVRAAGPGGFDGAARLALPVFEDGSWDGGDRDRVSSVLHGLYWLTSDLADQRPLALIIDDAQSLDAASARFLTYLAGRLEGLAVAVVVAFRSGELPDDVGLAAALTQHAQTTLRPGPLSQSGSGAVVRGVLGPRADDDLCRSCHDATRGNPFYLRELALAIATEGGRPSADALARTRALRVSAITSSVLVRLSRLGADCELFSEALAILGSRASLRQVATLAGLQRDRARLAADRLHEAEIITAGSELSFVHPIVHEAVLSEIPPARRAALHGQAARLLATEDPSIDRVAAHLLLSEPYGDECVVDLLRRAAREALSRGAPEAAVELLARTAREPPSAQTRVPVLMELGQAQALLPTAQDFAVLREALSSARTTDERSEVAYALALALFGVFRNSEAVAVLEDALVDIEPDSATAQRLEAAMIGGGIGDLRESPRLLERAVRHFERARRAEIDDPLMLSSLAQTAAVGGSSADEAVSLARRSIADGRLLGDWLNAGYMGAVIGLSFSDHPQEAMAAILAGLEVAQRRGSAPMLLQLNLFGADCALRTGDLDVAEDLARRLFELGRELGAEHAAPLLLPIVLLERGQIQDAHELLEPIDLSEPRDLLDTWLLTSRGRVRVEMGENEKGLGDLLEVDRLTTTARVFPSVDWVRAATVALTRLGRIEQARQLADRELQQATAFGAPRRYGIATATAGRFTSGQDGIDRLEEAAEVLWGCGARLEYARARLDLGVRLRRGGDGQGARAPLADALETADACGGWAVSERARAELIATGARPRRASRTGPRSLTPAELRVATLAAEGLSNRQIAQTLFLSTKTIEGQLSHAYAKLKISSRADLAKALAADRVTTGSQLVAQTAAASGR